MALPIADPQPRRFILRAAVASLALALAGCQTLVPKGAPPPTGPTTTTPTKPTGPGAGLPEDAERNRVAVLVPMTGPNAAVGQSIANAANLAILDTGGAKVRITVYDTATGAAAAANRALAEGNKLFLGPLLSEDVAQVAPAARAANVPVVSFSNDTTVAGNGVFVMGFDPNQSIHRVVAYAQSKGLTRFAALIPSGVYGRRASNAMLKAAQDAGANVVAMESYDRSAASLTNAIKKLGGPGAYDALLIADGGRISIQAAPLIRKQAGPGPRLLGTELWNTEAGLTASPALHGAWFASVSDTMYGQLANKYRARFGRAPYRLSSLGYDAVLLTVRIAGDWKVGSNFPAGKLDDKGGFAGVDGAFRFGKDGVAERSLEVQQVGAAGFTTIAPAPRGFE